jgi:hypothetical protein
MSGWIWLWIAVAVIVVGAIIFYFSTREKA